jgi:hypothetical protein
MSAHVLPPLAVQSKSEWKVNSLPPLGFEPVTFGMITHLSDHSAKPLSLEVIQKTLIYSQSNKTNKQQTKLKMFRATGLKTNIKMSKTASVSE